jgi:transposase
MKSAREQLVFSDEHFVSVNDYTERRCFARSRRDVPVRARLSRHNVPSLQVWAACGVGFRSPLVVVRSSVDEETGRVRRQTSDTYIRSCLARVVPELVRRKHTFQFDGARCHVSKKVLDYLTRKRVSYVANWPPYSPDISPIEFMWPILDREISKLGPRTLDELHVAARKAWDNIPQAKIDAVVLGFQSLMKKFLSKQPK